MHGHCDLTDDWSAIVSLTAGAHFRCSFGCVLLLNQIFLNNVPFDNIPLQFIWSICSGNWVRI